MYWTCGGSLSSFFFTGITLQLVILGCSIGITRDLEIRFFILKSEISTWKLQTYLKFRPFKKTREARDRESARAGERDVALSHSRASRFLKPVNFRHVWGFHVFSCENLAFLFLKIKRRGSRSRVAPTKHHSIRKMLFKEIFLLFD